MAALLYHITRAADWAAAQQAGVYRDDSLSRAGFIHCSCADQVASVATARFAGRTDLVLLAIDPSRLAAPVRREGEPGGPLFPHVYGPIEVDAVVSAEPYGEDAQGCFPDPS